MSDRLEFFIPSNRVDSKGRRTHVDGWNEYIKAVNKGWKVGAARERENVQLVADYARLAMNNAPYAPLDVPARVEVTFIERDMRRDVPNVFGGLKWVLDGLSRPRGSKRLGAGLIYDDSPRWVDVVPRVDYYPARPGIEISVSPLEGAEDACTYTCPDCRNVWEMRHVSDAQHNAPIFCPSCGKMIGQLVNHDVVQVMGTTVDLTLDDVAESISQAASKALKKRGTR